MLQFRAASNFRHRLQKPRTLQPENFAGLFWPFTGESKCERFLTRFNRRDGFLLLLRLVTGHRDKTIARFEAERNSGCLLADRRATVSGWSNSAGSFAAAKTAIKGTGSAWPTIRSEPFSTVPQSSSSGHWDSHAGSASHNSVLENGYQMIVDWHL